MPTNTNLNYSKFANVVLYLLQHSAPERPGSTHLLKMLWYADYWHYRRHLQTITSGEYIAMARGPALSGYKELFEKLRTEQIVEIHNVPVFQSDDKIELRPLMGANDSVFSEAERETLEQVIRECADESGNALSRRSHGEPPWMIAYPVRPYEAIPYSLFRWLDNAPSEADIAKAKTTLALPECRQALAALA